MATPLAQFDKQSMNKNIKNAPLKEASKQVNELLNTVYKNENLMFSVIYEESNH
jgi:hypothetical protein